jgi:hypothetical protein
MAHEFVYFEAKGATIRACKFCTCSSVLLGTQKDMAWESVLEQDGTQIMASEECGVAPERGTKKGLAAVDAAAKRRDERGAAPSRAKKVLCYCNQCEGRESHYADAKNCYCRQCNGRREHY